jgi:hypothetical protein
MLYFLFRLSRKYGVQCFRLRSLLCPIIGTAAAIAADCSAFDEISAAIAADCSAFEENFPHTEECASQ